MTPTINQAPEGQLAPFCRACGERLYPHGIGEFACPDCGEPWTGALFDLAREARINAGTDALVIGFQREQAVC